MNIALKVDHHPQLKNLQMFLAAMKNLTLDPLAASRVAITNPQDLVEQEITQLAAEAQVICHKDQ